MTTRCAKMKSNKPFIIAICLTLFWGSSAVQGSGQTSPMPSLDCQQCHTCESPTEHDPCLTKCPRLTMLSETGEHRLSEGPDKIVIDHIAKLYRPVQFDHKLHASMAEMGSDCATCHHYSPAGRVPPCKECHGGEANPENLRQPSLKGAYHRQCISCHREWSHDTRCVVCHMPIAGKEMSAPQYDTTDIIGTIHPVITVPESCGKCHDLQKGPRPPKTEEEIHADCSDCHEDDNCSRCHAAKEKTSFSHASTGWPLNRYHEKLDCRACHPKGKKISKLNRQCNACHAGWNQENFRHAVTGLRLDEIHAELECADCHIDRKFDKKPDCTSCHDDDRTAEDAPPGESVK